ETVLWELASKQERARIHGHITDMHFSPDGKRFTTQELDAVKGQLTVRLWELSPDSGPELVAERTFPATCGAISPDLVTLATVRAIPDPPHSFSVHLWDLASGAEKGKCVETNEPKELGSLYFSPRGRFLLGNRHHSAVDDDRDSPILWDLQTELTRVSR